MLTFDNFSWELIVTPRWNYMTTKLKLNENTMMKQNYKYTVKELFLYVANMTIWTRN